MGNNQDAYTVTMGSDSDLNIEVSYCGQKLKGVRSFALDRHDGRLRATMEIDIDNAECELSFIQSH